MHVTGLRPCMRNSSEHLSHRLVTQACIQACINTYRRHMEMKKKPVLFLSLSYIYPCSRHYTLILFQHNYNIHQLQLVKTHVQFKHQSHLVMQQHMHHHSTTIKDTSWWRDITSSTGESWTPSQARSMSSLHESNSARMHMAHNCIKSLSSARLFPLVYCLLYAV